MAERDPLLSRPPTPAPEKAPQGRFVDAVQLEAGQWSVEHGKEIRTVLPRGDGGVKLTLEDGTVISLDRNEELLVSEKFTNN